MSLARLLRFLACAGILTCAGLTACGGGPPGPLKLKLGHVAAPDSLVAEAANEFARRVNEKLLGRAEVVVFGSSQLGSDEILLQKLKLGTVDFAIPSTVMSSFVDAFGFFEMPYLVEDREHMQRIEEEIFWPRLAPLAESKGFKILGLWENGFRHITNNTRPIVHPDDLQGIKLRTPAGVWRVRLFQTYGASPTPMALSEVFVALQTGVLDGQENPFTQIHSSKFHEVQTYLTLTGHVYSPAYLTAGTRRWQELPADLRPILETAARDMGEYIRRQGERIDRELLARLQAAGMQVNQADRASFVKASQAIYEEFSRSVPGAGEWIKTALALANS